MVKSWNALTHALAKRHNLISLATRHMPRPLRLRTKVSHHPLNAAQASLNADRSVTSRSPRVGRVHLRKQSRGSQVASLYICCCPASVMKSRSSQAYFDD